MSSDQSKPMGGSSSFKSRIAAFEQGIAPAQQQQHQNASSSRSSSPSLTPGSNNNSSSGGVGGSGKKDFVAHADLSNLRSRFDKDEKPLVVKGSFGLGAPPPHQEGRDGGKHQWRSEEGEWTGSATVW